MNEQKKVSICENCKRYWLEPPQKCECGSHSYASTHPSNADKAEDKEVVAFLDSVEPFKASYDDDDMYEFHYTSDNRELLKQGYIAAATQQAAEIARLRKGLVGAKDFILRISNHIDGMSLKECLSGIDQALTATPAKKEVEGEG